MFRAAALSVSFIRTCALFIASAVAAAAAAAASPPTITYNGTQLAFAKDLIGRGDPRVTAALAALLREADEAITLGPFTVMSKNTTPPSGKKKK